MIQRYAIRIQDREGFERRVSLGEVTIMGRQKQCDVVLPDEMISRLHLRVEYKDGKCWAEDMGSSHGTFKDGERIKRIQWEPNSIIIMANGAYRLMLVPERLQATEANMQAILSSAHYLTGDYSLEQLLHRALDHLLRLSAQDRGFIMLSDELDEDRLKIFVSRNFVSDIDNDPSLSMTAVKRVFDTGMPIWLSDISASDTLSSQKSVIDMQIKTVVCLPLSVKEKRIGVVYLDSRRLKAEMMDPSAFEAIVGLCAVAIERTRMFEESHRNRLLAAVGSVASNIVHDFKNTLFLIGGHAEILSELCSGPEAHHHVEQIESSVERLTAMCSEILEWERMKPMQKTTVELAQILNNEIDNWQMRAKELGIVITGSGPECMANIEVPKFISVMDNLFTNSIDALADSGPKGLIQLSWNSDKGGITIKITDNGKGIPKEMLKKIFEPFFSFGKEKGTGLGMPMVKKIVEGHGGTIAVVSEKGQGTTITIHLPHETGTKPYDDEDDGTSG